jgi:hypothetical protein
LPIQLVDGAELCSDLPRVIRNIQREKNELHIYHGSQGRGR